MGYLAPTIGSWYQDDTDGKLFEVVATDDKSGTIEVQYEDGNISEFDTDTWSQLPLLTAAAPENANGAFEAGFEEDWGENSHHYDDVFTNPLDAIEPDIFTGFDDAF